MLLHRKVAVTQLFHTGVHFIWETDVTVYQFWHWYGHWPVKVGFHAVLFLDPVYCMAGWPLETEGTKEGGQDCCSYDTVVLCHISVITGEDSFKCVLTTGGDMACLLQRFQWSNGLPDVLLCGPCYLWSLHPVIEERVYFGYWNKYLVLAILYLGQRMPINANASCIVSPVRVVFVMLTEIFQYFWNVFQWALEELFEAV